jgi:beta-glucuronidase
MFSLLYPQQNQQRNVLDLSGLWQFQEDPHNIGIEQGWFRVLPVPSSIAVPGSWNEQHERLRDYTDAAWYATDVWVPQGWHGQRIFVRIGSANYFARVWVNGVEVGAHEGGHLPFGFDITEHIQWDAPNHFAICVDNTLRQDRLPPGGVGMGGSTSMLSGYPLTSYDFFPYAGLQRQVWLMGLPAVHIHDITVNTEFTRQPDGIVGQIHVKVQANGAYQGSGNIAVEGAQVTLQFQDGKAEGTLVIANAKLWGPGHPHLYALHVTLGNQDSYTLEVGIRTFAVKGDRLYLNDEPITLKGFGKHEDFAGSGRGLNFPVLVKDYDLLRWVGANSYRTAHYPYSEEAMQMADRHGVLIIDETPAVGLAFHLDAAVVKRHYELCLQATEALIERDKNHACVIAWSIANEPVAGSFFAPPMPDSPAFKNGAQFLDNLIAQTKELDPSRAVTFAGMQISPNAWFANVDIICVNRYYGWYFGGGQLASSQAAFAAEMSALHKQYGKPIIVSEFGADTVAGMHAQPPEMWSEEYQVEVLKFHLDYADAHPYIAGLHIWNFADFKTAQGIIRMGGMNLKGVFTRDRRPKMAAHLLRSYWAKTAEHMIERG